MGILRGIALPVFLMASLAAADAAEPVVDHQAPLAKPGMALLYMIQGDFLKGPVSVGPGADGASDFYTSGNVWDGKTTVYGSGPSAIGVLAAALIGAAIHHEPEAPPTEMIRVKPIASPSHFFLDHKTAAATKKSEYAVADIAPGTYELKLCFGLRDCVIHPLELVEGQVVYLVANADVPNGPILEVCHQNCGERIRDAQEISAFPKPGSNIPGF